MESVLEPEEELMLYLFCNFVGELPKNYTQLSFNKFKGRNNTEPFTYVTLRYKTLKEDTDLDNPEFDTTLVTYSLPSVWYNKLLKKYEVGGEESLKDWSNDLNSQEVEDSSITVLRKQNADKLINPYLSHMYDHDTLNKYVTITEEFKQEFRLIVANITNTAKKLNTRSIKKDHDLILTFKANDEFNRLIVGLNIVPPKLPEEQLEIGDRPVALKDWEDMGHEKSILTIIKRIVVLNKNANHLITHTKQRLFRLNKGINDHFLKAFDITVKEQLLSSSHFMTPIYEFDTDDGIRALEKVASDILNVLDKYKTNIGLDLNEWMCYEYSADKPPVKMLQVELNFRDSILNRYTDSFIRALYDYLLKIEHRAIKPYSNKTVVTQDDGIKIGEMRIVED